MDLDAGLLHIIHKECGDGRVRPVDAASGRVLDPGFDRFHMLTGANAGSLEIHAGAAVEFMPFSKKDYPVSVAGP